VSRDRYPGEDVGGLTPDAFDFVFSNELKRAVRSQNFLTLVLVAAKPSDPRAAVDPAATMQHVARIISGEVRETDLLAERDKGELSLVLLDADLRNSMQVVDRLLARFSNYEFAAPVAIEIAAACCPTHGADPETLRRAARARAMPPLKAGGNASNAQ
jgi:hypothetical protein